MSDVKVLQIPRGSLIVINGVEFGDHGLMDMLAQCLREKLGHDEFVVLHLDGDGTVEVVGTVEEMVERVRVALDEADIAHD